MNVHPGIFAGHDLIIYGNELANSCTDPLLPEDETEVLKERIKTLEARCEAFTSQISDLYDLIDQIVRNKSGQRRQQDIGYWAER